MLVRKSPAKFSRRPTVEQELKKADAIIITYATDRQETFSRLRSHWLPEVRRLKLKAPICLVGCKQDLRTDRQPALEQVRAVSFLKM